MHVTLYCCLLLVFSPTYLCENAMLNKTQLIFGFMTHRHGDRAPLPYAIQFISDKEKAMALSNKYGYGQLTNGGRRRGYELGKFIRRRYGSLLSRQYNRSEIYLRSTDSTRTKMTMLTAMAAVYPPTQDNWSKDINWTPTPYTTKLARYDDMLAVFNCPNFIDEVVRRSKIRVPELDKYECVLNELSKTLGVNITRDYNTVLRIYDAFISQMSLGIPFDPKVKKLIPDIKKAADEALEYLFGDGEIKILPLQSGVLLREFFVEVDKILNGVNVPRIRVYSGHDVNVYPFARISKSKPSIGVPFYGSLFALELRKVVGTGRYIVVPVYLKEPSAKEQYLQIDGCGELCDLQQYRKLTSKSLLDLNQWYDQCGYTEDLKIDTSSID